MSFIALFTVLACQPLDRSGFVMEQLWLDNRKWWYREPTLLNEKFLKMDADIYDFMRGTQRLHWASTNRPGEESAPFIQQADSMQVLIFGDPHPENWAVLARADGSYQLEMIDLDGVEFGPWTFDVQRLSLGLSVLSAQLDGCDCSPDVVRSALQGYIDGLESGEVLEGKMWQSILMEAQIEGREQKRLFSKTSLVGGEYRFSDSLDEVPLPVSEWIAQQNVRLLDVTQVYGRGVSSLPAIRYLVLWDKGESGVVDDHLCFIRELSDPVIFSEKSFVRNADRLRFAQEVLWASNPLDWQHDTVVAQGLDWKSIGYDSWIQSPDHDKIIEQWWAGEIQLNDVMEFAYSLGSVMGSRHRNSPSRSGEFSILSDIEKGGGKANFVEHFVAGSERDKMLLWEDWGIFQGFIAEYGPSLGWRR